MKIIGIPALLFLSIVLLYSCSKSNDDDGGSAVDCSSVPKSFATDVNPLIQTFCNQAGCHANGSSNGPGPLTNYAQVSAAKDLIRSAVQSGRMPQNTTLYTAQKNTIICWIDSGAPNNWIINRQSAIDNCETSEVRGQRIFPPFSFVFSLFTFHDSRLSSVVCRFTLYLGSKPRPACPDCFSSP